MASRLEKGVLLTAALLGALALGQASWGADGGDDDDGSGAERVYYALRYVDPVGHDPASARTHLDGCVAGTEGSRLVDSTSDPVPAHTLSVVDDGDAHLSLADCLRRSAGVELSRPQRSTVPVAVSSQLYQVHYDRATYTDAAYGAVSVCVAAPGGSHRSTTTSWPPVPTVSMTGLPAEQEAFADCLRRVPSLRELRSPTDAS